jgi:hypothetical protein
VIGSKTRLVLASLFVAAHAHAQGSSASDQTLAQTLFDQAVTLMDQGRYSEACPKLAESQHLDPGGGTLLNLGLCRQNEGKLASAWAAYNDALSQAIKDGRKEREDNARVHVKDLEGKVAKLAIDVEPSRRVTGLEVRLDGTSIRQVAWGEWLPIDRGEHALVATAPGRREYRTTVIIGSDGVNERISIPKLAEAPVVETVVQDRGAAEAHGWLGQGLVGWVLGGVGVAFLGVGIVGGILAIDYRHQSDAYCPNDHCSVRGVDLNDQAKTFAWLADVGIGVGIISVGTGLVMILSAPKTNKAALRVVPTVGAHEAGVGVVGRF